MSWSVSAQNHLLGRVGVQPRWLLWVEAKVPGTLAAAPVGLWNGGDDLTFTIDGSPRVYNGALSTFEIEPITYGTGLDVRSLRITLAANAPETEDLVRGYLIRLAQVELHLALFDPMTDALIEANPMWRGFINRAPLSTSAQGGAETVSLEIVSQMRLLAMPGPALKKTDAAQKKRDGDRFRRYGSTAGQFNVSWVQKK